MPGNNWKTETNIKNTKKRQTTSKTKILQTTNTKDMRHKLKNEGQINNNHKSQNA